MVSIVVLLLWANLEKIAIPIGLLVLLNISEGQARTGGVDFVRYFLDLNVFAFVQFFVYIGILFERLLEFFVQSLQYQPVRVHDVSVVKISYFSCGLRFYFVFGLLPTLGEFTTILALHSQKKMVLVVLVASDPRNFVFEIKVVLEGGVENI